MGYALGVGPCYACGKTFGFNPNKVPSVKDENNEKQPICKSCVDKVNKLKIEAGMPVFEINPDAYEPVDENELG